MSSPRPLVVAFLGVGRVGNGTIAVPIDTKVDATVWLAASLLDKGELIAFARQLPLGG